ncbi:MAG: ThiF family adenylyltransferase [Dermatophilaceae bacterium]
MAPTTPDSAYYRQLTTRNAGFISVAAQERLRRLTVLVAGCGSTGGAAVEPLVRVGVQHFLLAEPGDFEVSNLNRQSAFLDEVGRNKATVAADRIRAINPHASTLVDTDGITAANVEALVRAADVVIDGVDVTERSGWLAKWLLHEAAAALGRPVVSGWDMAGTQYVRFYDYRAGARRPFDGAITRAQIDDASTWELMRRAVPMRMVPVEMLVAARAAVSGTATDGLAQLVYASMLFGALSSRIVVCIAEGKRVRRHTLLSVDAAISPGRDRLRRSLRKPVEAALALRDLAILRAGAGHG